MKIIGLLLLTIINAQLAHGTLFAAPPSPTQNQTASESAPKAVSDQSNRPSGDGAPHNDARAGGETRHSRRAARSRPPSKAVAANSTRPEQIARHRESSAPGNPADVRSFASTQSGAVVNHSSPQNEAIYRALPVRPGAAIRPASPFAGAVPHRDPNAAVIGGAARAADSNIRSTAAINGTRTNLRVPRN
jgi:hypothetical protein